MPTPEEEQQQKPGLLKSAAKNIFSWNTYYAGMATAVAAVGVATLAAGAVVGAPNIALAAGTTAFEVASMTPRYEKLANTKIGKICTKGFRTVFNRTSLRVFRAAMIGVGIATASGFMAGAPVIALGAVNAAGIGYNMYREVHELRKSRKLCRQEQNLQKLRKFSKVKEQAIAQEPALAKTLGITLSKESKKALSPEPVGDISRWLKVKLFARKMIDNIAESASGIAEALGNFAASPVAGVITMAAMVGVGEGTKVEYRSKQRNRKLREGLRKAGYDPKSKEDIQILEKNAVEEQANLMAFAEVKKLINKGTLSRDNPKGLQQAFGGFKMVYVQELEQKNAEKYKSQSVMKDLVALHTNIYKDPLDATYEKHDSALEKLDVQVMTMQAKLGIKVSEVREPSKVVEKERVQDLSHGKKQEREVSTASPPTAERKSHSVSSPTTSSIASTSSVDKREFSAKERSTGQKIVAAMKKMKRAVSSRLGRSSSGRGRGAGGMSR